MHARVTLFRIRPGKLEEFAAAVDSMIPMMHRQPGFKALLVLRDDPSQSGSPGATVITAWDSLDSLRASENDLYFYQAMARVLAFSEGFPVIQEHEVLAREFPALA